MTQNFCFNIIKNSKSDIFVEDFPNDLGKYVEFTMYDQRNMRKYVHNFVGKSLVYFSKYVTKNK